MSEKDTQNNVGGNPTDTVETLLEKIKYLEAESKNAYKTRDEAKKAKEKYEEELKAIKESEANKNKTLEEQLAEANLKVTQLTDYKTKTENKNLEFLKSRVKSLNETERKQILELLHIDSVDSIEIAHTQRISDMIVLLPSKKETNEIEGGANPNLVIQNTENAIDFIMKKYNITFEQLTDAHFKEAREIERSRLKK